MHFGMKYAKLHRYLEEMRPNYIHPAQKKRKECSPTCANHSCHPERSERSHLHITVHHSGDPSLRSG